MPTGPSLAHRRKRLAQAWQSYMSADRDTRTELPGPAGIRPEIVTSWERSADRVPVDVASAPVDDPADTAS